MSAAVGVQAWFPSRILVIALILIVSFLSRIDHLVSVAVGTNWLSITQAESWTADSEWCAQNTCHRLPPTWIGLYVALTIAAAVLTLVILHRQWPTTPAAPATEPNGELAVARFLRAALVLAYAVLVGARIGSSVWGGRVGEQPSTVVVAICAPLTLVLTGVLLVVLWRASAGAEASHRWRAGLRVAGRQRVTLVVLAAFVLTVAVLPLGKDQVADSLRAVGVGSATGWAQLAAFVAAAALFCVTVYESSSRTESRGEVSASVDVGWRWWLVVGLAITGVGVLAWWLSGIVGLGVALLGAIFLLMAILTAVPVVLPSSAESETSAPDADLEPAESSPGRPNLPGYLAAVPLLALATASTQALLDTVVTDDRVAARWTPEETGLVLAFIALVGLAVWVSQRRSVLPATSQLTMREWVLGAGLPVVLAMAASRIPANPSLSVAVAVVFAVAFYWGAILATSEGGRFSGRGYALPVAVGIAVSVGIATHVNPQLTGSTLGAAGILCTFFAQLVALGFILTTATDRFSAPALFARFGVARLPIVSILVVWWIVAGLAAPGALHNVRLMDRGEEAAEPAPTLAEAFDRWLVSQPEFEYETAEDDGASVEGVGYSENSDPHAVPLVIVASHGGGIRAAYWTGMVMDCLVARTPVAGPFGGSEEVQPCARDRQDASGVHTAASRIFLASGVSGGSVGLAAFAYERAARPALEREWVDGRLGTDLLSPVVAWALHHDLPNHFLGLHSDDPFACSLDLGGACVSQDRAAVLEDAIAGHGSADVTLRGSWGDVSGSQGAVFPLMVFNASSTGDTSRALVSQVDLSPWPEEAWEKSTGEASLRPVVGAADVVDALCQRRDLALSTAAVLSARFPFVSPSGTIDGRCGDMEESEAAIFDACRNVVACQLQMADGGYVDNSGMLTVSQVLPELRRLIENQNRRTPDNPIALFVVEIDNDYQDDSWGITETARVPESLIPLRLALGAGAAVESVAREEVSAARTLDCYTTFAPPIRPGIQAPLGWYLSDATRAQLTDALEVSAAGIDYNDYWTARNLHDLQSVLAYDGTDSHLRDRVHACIPGPRNSQEFIQGTWRCDISGASPDDARFARVDVTADRIRVGWQYETAPDLLLKYSAGEGVLATDSGLRIEFPDLAPPDGTSWVLDATNESGEQFTLRGERREGSLNVRVDETGQTWACNPLLDGN